MRFSIAFAPRPPTAAPTIVEISVAFWWSRELWWRWSRLSRAREAASDASCAAKPPTMAPSTPTPMPDLDVLNVLSAACFTFSSGLCEPSRNRSGDGDRSLRSLPRRDSSERPADEAGGCDRGRCRADGTWRESWRPKSGFDASGGGGKTGALGSYARRPPPAALVI